MERAQKEIYVLQLSDQDKANIHNYINLHNLKKIRIELVENLLPTEYIFSNENIETSDQEGNCRTYNYNLLTFIGLIKRDSFQIIDFLKEIIMICSKAMGQHIEIGFAINLPNSEIENVEFNILKLRSMKFK